MDINVYIEKSLDEDLRQLSELQWLIIVIHHFRSYFTLHSDLFEPIDLNEFDFPIKLLKMPIDKEIGRKNEGLNKEVMGLAVTRIAIDNYANAVSLESSFGSTRKNELIVTTLDASVLRLWSRYRIPDV